MNCTHPVLYRQPDGLRCHICGALIGADEKPQTPEEKAAQTPKKPAKRKAAKVE